MVDSSDWMTTFARVLAVSLLAACGGNDEADDSDEEPATQLQNGELACGAVGCALPAEWRSSARACCLDPFKGVCGITTRYRDDCRELPKADPRCPALDELDLSLIFSGPSGAKPLAIGCCTSDNECGLDIVGDYSNTAVGIEFVGGGGPPSPTENCASRSSMCQIALVLELSLDSIMPQTCDGQPLELPPECYVGPFPQTF
jgi:hypothetical protein